MIQDSRISNVRNTLSTHGNGNIWCMLCLDALFKFVALVNVFCRDIYNC